MAKSGWQWCAMPKEYGKWHIILLVNPAQYLMLPVSSNISEQILESQVLVVKGIIKFPALDKSYDSVQEVP